MTKKVAVALSGGVDSSVTALLLKQAGYDVLGITAQTSHTVGAEQVVKNAQKVAETIGIDFYPIDFSAFFKENIINYFEKSYYNGETPNPCTICNQKMKWGVLFDYAIKTLKADYIATGHYAKIEKINNNYLLFPASDEHKDQLYFLFLLNQDQLSKTMFPLSNFKKNEVRQIAYKNDLPSKSSKDSQDICFIQAPMTTKKYLNEIYKAKEGNFIEEKTGRKLGKHTGFWQFTIGQRKGIGIASPEPLYVTKLDPITNTVFLGRKEELYSENIILRNVNWSYEQKEDNFEALVKIRYNMKAILADININDNSVNIAFKEKVSAITPGQACVIYNKSDGHLMGGAFIK